MAQSHHLPPPEHQQPQDKRGNFITANIAIAITPSTSKRPQVWRYSSSVGALESCHYTRHPCLATSPSLFLFRRLY